MTSEIGGHARRWVIAGLLAAVLLLAVATSAPASNVVYVENNDVWAASPDGTIQQRITTDGSAGQPYRSPSETDDGTIVVPKGDFFYRFKLDGSSGGGPWTSFDINSCSTGPQSAEVAPDDSLITYVFGYSDLCLGGSTITPRVATANATGPTPAGTFPTFDGEGDPRWIPGQPGAAMIDETETEIDAEEGSPAGLQTWLGPFSNGYLQAFDISRSGYRVLIAVTATAAPTSGSSDLWVWNNVDGPPDASQGQLVCTLSGWGDYNSQPVWSPDGSQFAWSTSAGVYVSPAPTADGSGNCVIHPTLIAPGGTDPAWGTASLVDEAPTALFTVPGAAVAGSPITFSGSGSDPDGGISGYSWSFGDSSAAATGASVSHTYANPGSYTATLTVTDSSGQTATASRVVAVTAAPSNNAGLNGNSGAPPPPHSGVKGYASCRVPAVKGLRVARAKRALRSAHCSVGRITRVRSRHVAQGHVVSQRPRRATVLRAGAAVSLVVSGG